MFGTKRHSFADLLEGAIIGGSIAAVATFMFGTARGKKIQKALLARVAKLRSKAAKTTKKLTSKKTERAIKRKIKSRIRRVRAKAARKVAGPQTARRRRRRTTVR